MTKMIMPAKKATRKNVVERINTTLRLMPKMIKKLTKFLMVLTRTALMASKRKTKKMRKKRPG
jgi:hypothetical protein